MAQPLRIDFAPKVSGGHLNKPAHISHSRTVDGTVFFRLIKSDPTIVRLLTGRAQPHDRLLAKAAASALCTHCLDADSSDSIVP